MDTTEVRGGENGGRKLQHVGVVRSLQRVGSLKDLDSGDLKHHTDFRQVYATLLDNWLGVDSNAILNGKFEHLSFLKAKKA